MDVLKQQLARIQAQLGGLNSTQKMLAGSLVVIMVMTMLWWGRYAGAAEMEPVLSESLDSTQVARIAGELHNRGIDARVSGTSVLVPSDRKLEAMADLAYAKLLPRDTSQSFTEMLKQVSPWDPEQLTEAKLIQGKGVALSDVIRRFPGVSDASVVIDATNDRVIGADRTPSAGVYIETQGGGNPQLLAQAAVEAVSGGAGVGADKVKVIIDGKPQRLSSGDADATGMDSGEAFSATQRNEKYYNDKIRDELSYLPDVKVNTTVEIDVRAIEEQSRTYDKQKSLELQQQTETKEDTSQTTAAAPSAEPGVVPNTGMSLAGGSAGGGGTTTGNTDETATYAPYAAFNQQNIKSNPGKATVVAAAVRVPMSYFERVWKHRNPDGKQPDDAVLQPLVDAELPKIKADVKNCTALADDSKISVETYIDYLPDPVGTGAGAGTTMASTVQFASLAKTYGKPAGVGLLAMVSLFMVSSMVKKSTPGPVTVASDLNLQPAGGRGGLGGGLNVIAGESVAEVTGGEQMLDGMELDDEAIRAAQMLDQVQSMVKQNPENAASLVKRWMNRN